MAAWIGSEAIGGLGGFLTTISFIPQVAKVLRERQTAGISVKMYIIFTAGVALWLVYGVLISSISVIVANVFTVILASAVLLMKLHLDHGWFRRAARRSEPNESV